MTQQLRVLATLPEVLGSIPRIPTTAHSYPLLQFQGSITFFWPSRILHAHGAQMCMQTKHSYITVCFFFKKKNLFFCVCIFEGLLIRYTSWPQRTRVISAVSSSLLWTLLPLLSTTLPGRSLTTGNPEDRRQFYFIQI